MTTTISASTAFSFRNVYAGRNSGKTGTAPAFEAALSAAGQNKTATSTQPAATQQPPATQQPASLTTLGGKRYSLAGLTADYQEWRTGYERNVLADRRQAVESQSGPYLALLEKASAGNAMADPKAFLKTLSGSELETLRTIHSLADPINPDGLTDEGAQNLILPPNRAEDVDHDGFNMVGLAKTWQFPPSDAPESVRQAWKAATKDLSGEDMMILTGSFLPLTAKVINGGSAYIPPDADYQGITADILARVTEARRYDQSWQIPHRDRQIALLNQVYNAFGDTAAGA